MQNDISGMEYFPPPKRHAYLDGESVRRLVHGVKAGLEHPANLEKTRDGWRLRVKFRLADGKHVRRSITIPDGETAEWVAEYLEKSRRTAAKQRSSVQNKEPASPPPFPEGEQP